MSKDENTPVNEAPEIEAVCGMCTTNCTVHAKYVDGKPYVTGSRCPRGERMGEQKLLKASAEA